MVAATQGRGLDILVNNIGAVSPRLDGFAAISDEDWFQSVNLNLMAALPVMLAAGHGAIVTISSVNAFLPDPGVMDYSAAKAALSNFCKSLSKEVGPHGVRVNTVSPGPVDTDLWMGAGGVAATVARATGGDAADVAGSVAAQAVSGRFTHPAEVADVVLFLVSERASNITGADLTIDGGLITTL